MVVDDYKSIKLPDGNASGGRLAAPPLSVMVINFFTTVGLDGNIEIVAASCRGSSRGISLSFKYISWLRNPSLKFMSITYCKRLKAATTMHTLRSVYQRGYTPIAEWP